MDRVFRFPKSGGRSKRRASKPRQHRHGLFPYHHRLCLEPLEYRRLLNGASPVSASVDQAYGQIPMSFEVNQGQTDARVQYLTRGNGYALFLTHEGAVLDLEQPSAPVAVPSSAPASITGVALSMNLMGANPQAAAEGEDLLPGTSNYFIGNDSTQWRTGVANYGRVVYQDVYPGVNLIYCGNQQQLEYDFTVVPGADPGSIRLSFQGVDRMSLDAQGDLVLHTALGDVLQHAPVVYQDVGGARQAVVGQFVLFGNDEVGFRVVAYDSTLPLVIDPVLSYSNILGGGGSYGGIAVDAAGNAYITCGNSGGFPTTPGAFQINSAGDDDALVVKFNVAGTALVYSTYLGGSDEDDGIVIAVDGAGNAYVAGTTWSTDFPTTPGAFQTSHASDGGVSDAFVAKLNATGTALIYSTYLGGNRDDFAQGIAVDSAGNAYVTGSTASTNFPTTSGAFQSSKIGPMDAFVAKLDAAGAGLIYSTYLGANAQAGTYDMGTGSCIAVDSAGNAYVVGNSGSPAFPTTPGAFQISPRGSDNAFDTKLNAAGTGLVYSTFLGGSDDDEADGIAVDAAGNAYVTGITDSTNFPITPGAFQTSLVSSEDGFVAKLNASGTALVYSTYLGGSDDDWSDGIAVDAAGNAYVTGQTYSSSFPTTADAFQTSHAIDGGDREAFVTVVNAGGTALLYSTYLGGNKMDLGLGIAVDAAGNVYVIGYTDSTDFPTTPGAFQSCPGDFVAKFSGLAVAATPTISSVSPPQPQAADGDQHFTINGIDFDGSAYVNLIDNGGVTHQMSGARILSLSSTQITIDPNFTSAGAGPWQAQVVNGSGQVSGWYPFPVVVAALTVPTAPILSNDAPIWDTTAPAGPAVNLYWTASTGTPAPLYDLYRNGTLESAYAANLSQTSFYNEVGLTLGQTYTYYVVAHNCTGTAQSNTLSVTIPASLGSTVPGVPAGLTASATAATSIQLTWTPVSDPGATYLVYRSTSSSGPWTLLQSNVAQASFDDVYSVEPSSTYYYAIESANADGTSGLSLPASATTPTLTTPEAPTIVSAVVEGTNQIVLMWTGVLSTGQYILLRATSPNGSYATIQTFDAGTTSYVDTLSDPSTASTTYEYRIYSQVNGVSSAPSSVVQATLSVPVNNKTVSSATVPTLTSPALDNIAQLYQFNGSAWTWDNSVTLLDGIKWTRPTVILTHGWDDSFAQTIDANGNVIQADVSSNFIQLFAKNFWLAHPSGYNVLAVDWNDNCSPLGSDPNGATSAVANIEKNGLALALLDAQKSATNGIADAIPLADDLFEVGFQPDKVMLIGHSNGAGFMASFAEECYTDEVNKYGVSGAQKIQELVALDAPVETASYWTVAFGAANVVGHIDNYYTPIGQSTVEDIWVPTPLSSELGFGAPMVDASNITNFEMNHVFNFQLDDGSGNYISHSEIPLRYATTASNTSTWGFATSDFMEGTGNSPYDGGLLWQEPLSPGYFVSLIPSPDAIVAFANSIRDAVVYAGAAVWQYTKDGAILLGNAVADTATEVYTFGAEGAITITNEVIDTADIVEQSVAAAVDTLTDIAVSGANFVVSGLNSAVQQSVDSVENWFGFTAHSPTFDSFAINVPQDAAFLDFDLTVTNPGNDDQLLVGIGNNVIGQVDLASVEQSGTQAIQLPIAQYAGETNQTLTFYMPSSVTSTAQFVVGNISVESLTVDTVPSVSNIAKDLDVGGVLTFATPDFTAAFADPDNNALQEVMITALPQHGTLSLGTTAVVLDQEIPVASLSSLSYTPAASYVGSDSFGWNGSDGSLYAVAGATVNLTVNAVWTAAGGGTFSWGSGGNWQSGVVPGASGGAALLGAAVGSGTATITLDAAQSLSSLTFNPGTGGSYTLSGSAGDWLQLANSSSSASISVGSGASAINTPVVLGDDVNVTAAAGTSLLISGPISEGGGSQGLTFSGSGSLALSGTGTYTGGTTVSAGTLIVTSASALMSGTALSVGASVTFMFDPSNTTPSALVAAPTPVMANSADTIATSITPSAAMSPIPSVATAVPSSISPAFSGPVLLPPTVAWASASSGVATPSSVSASDPVADSPVRSSATVVAPLLPASPPVSKTNKSRTFSIAAGTFGASTVHRLVRSSIARSAAGDLAWLWQAANSSDNWDQHRKKDVAILALDAVFAEYGP
jgi:autotransporter-associated beta strand protein